MDTKEPITGESKEATKPAPMQELHAAIMWRETPRLAAKLNAVIRAVNWLLAHP